MVDGVRAEGVAAGRIGGPSFLGRDGARPAAAGFSVAPGPDSVARNARLSAAPAIGLESLLALQSVDEALERDRAARKRGTAMVAALTDLQRALLAEEDPALALRSLSELAVDGPLGDDPELAAILRAVVLRSRVEVARRARRDG